MLWQLSCGWGGCSLSGLRAITWLLSHAAVTSTCSLVLTPPLLQIIDVLHPGRPNVPKVRDMLHLLLGEQKSASWET